MSNDHDPKSFHEAWMAEQFAEEFEEERKRKLSQAEALAEAAQGAHSARAAEPLPEEEDVPEEPEDPSVVKTYVFISTDCQVVVMARTEAEAKDIIRREMADHIPYGILDEEAARPEILKEGEISWCWS